MTEQRAPQNTTAHTAENPLGFLAASMWPGGASQAIEEQERSGQAQIVNSTVLPTEGSDDPRLLELGFTFGDQVAGDPMFREATLPEGWTRESSDHAMHSHICDERGVRRVNVFYKAAFYDRRADMHIVSVGYNVATDAIYGDMSERVTLRDDLTIDELDEAASSTERYIADALRHPETYSDRLPRAQHLRSLIGVARKKASS